MNVNRNTIVLAAAGVATALLFAANLFVGSVHIPFGQVVDIVLGRGAEKETWEFIVLQTRLPQAVTAAICGASLATAGLLLQTVFANPLAGPSVLGISSGAGLGVALVIMAGGALGIGGFGAEIAGALAGAGAGLAAIVLFSTRVGSSTSLLIIGLMLSYLTSAAITLLNFGASAEKAHAFMVWGLGNFSGVGLQRLPALAIPCLAGLAVATLLVKPLNAMTLGADYARNLGINTVRTRNLLLGATGILTAATTAFCGPIAFIGLAVPHIARLLTRSAGHHRLLPATMLTGVATALLCNMACMAPGNGTVLPLNAVTPVIGAPVVIYVVINRRRINYFN